LWEKRKPRNREAKKTSCSLTNKKNWFGRTELAGSPIFWGNPKANQKEKKEGKRDRKPIERRGNRIGNTYCA